MDVGKLAALMHLQESIVVVGRRPSKKSVLGGGPCANKVLSDLLRSCSTVKKYHQYLERLFS